MAEQRVLKSKLKTKPEDPLARKKKRVRWWDQVDEAPTPWDAFHTISDKDHDSPVAIRRRTLFNWFEEETTSSLEDSFSADNQRKCPAVEVAQFPGWLNFQAARKEQKNTSTPQVRKPQISEEDIEYYVDSEGRELAKMCSIKTKKSNFLDKEQQLKSLQAARMNKDSSKLFQGNFDYPRDSILGCPYQFI